MDKLTPPVNESDKQRGNADFKITLVEYGDYQCPYCGMAHPLVKRLLEEKGDVIRFVFRNFPLQSIHSQAMNAARAAEAAAHQQRFWEMHDMLFENQDRFKEGVFADFAQALDMDADRFQRDFDSEKTASKVDADFKSGLHSGVNGTPSFFIDGSKIHLAELRYDELLRAIDAKLNVHTEEL